MSTISCSLESVSLNMKMFQAQVWPVNHRLMTSLQYPHWTLNMHLLQIPRRNVRSELRREHQVTQMDILRPMVALDLFLGRLRLPTDLPRPMVAMGAFGEIETTHLIYHQLVRQASTVRLGPGPLGPGRLFMTQTPPLLLAVERSFMWVSDIARRRTVHHSKSLWNRPRRLQCVTMKRLLSEVRWVRSSSLKILTLRGCA